MNRIELITLRNELLTELKKEKLGEKETDLPMAVYRSGYVDGVLDFFNISISVINKGGAIEETLQEAKTEVLT